MFRLKILKTLFLVVVAFVTIGGTVTPALAGQSAGTNTLRWLYGSGSATGGKVISLRVTLWAAAPAGGAVVSLKSSSPVITTPSSVTIPAGRTEAIVKVKSKAVHENTPVTITATYKNRVRTKQILILRPYLSSTTIQSRIRSGGLARFTVRLSGIAPEGGITVRFNSNRPSAVPVPATLYFPAGKASVTYIATGAVVHRDVNLNISAKYRGITITKPTILRKAKVTSTDPGTGGDEGGNVGGDTGNGDGGSVDNPGGNDGGNNGDTGGDQNGDTGGDNGDNTGGDGGSNDGGNQGDQGGDQGGDSGNQGDNGSDNGNDQGDNTGGDQNGDTGNQGGDNQGGDQSGDNQGDNGDQQGDTGGEQGGDTGNTGGDTGNTGGNQGGDQGDASGDGTATICHMTGNGLYTVATPNVAGIVNGHFGDDTGDIIPPVVYKDETYSQNWDATGQAIFNNGCVVPDSGTDEGVGDQTGSGDEQGDGGQVDTGDTGSQPEVVPDSENVMVCHMTGKGTYRAVTANAAGIYNGHLGDHDDIIPPFTFRGELIAGQNYDGDYLLIYNNGCSAP
jgi:hypothetical protein